VFASLAGCRQPLFTTDEPRSQYDRSAALQERRAPARIYNEYGASKANLRGRLLSTQ
jgi:hypothetical protein